MNQKVVQFPTTKLETPRILVTHTDLDGIACAVLYCKAYPNVELVFIDYDRVNETVEELAKSTDQHIMISDLSVNKEELAELLDKRGNVELIDHHPTAKWLADKYKWALVDTNWSATKHMYEVLSTRFNLQDYEGFVKLVDDYDTWGHGTKPLIMSQDLNRLREILGRDRFLARWIAQPSLDTSDLEDMLLTLDKEQEEKYIRESIEQVALVTDAQGNKYALLAADRYINNVGHTILDVYPDIEYVMMVNFRHSTVSLRGRGNVHLGQLAKKVGGGGHKKAAGFPLEGGVAEYFLNCGGKCKVTERLEAQIEQMRRENEANKPTQ